MDRHGGLLFIKPSFVLERPEGREHLAKNAPITFDADDDTSFRAAGEGKTISLFISNDNTAFHRRPLLDGCDDFNLSHEIFHVCIAATGSCVFKFFVEAL